LKSGKSAALLERVIKAKHTDRARIMGGEGFAKSIHFLRKKKETVRHAKNQSRLKTAEPLAKEKLWWEKRGVAWEGPQEA